MKTLSACLIASALFVLSGVPALADDVHCPPDLGSVTVDGNVLVAAPCRLDGTTVKGNVHLYSGGSLVARDANIDGNIQAENADFIDVADSEIGGSIQLDNLVGDLTVITGNDIDGSIQLKENRSRHEVTGNFVGADIQAFSNSGGVEIADNTVDGNLQCKSNEPAPTGGNNRVSGNEEDQCANLSPSGASAGSSAGSTSSAAAGGAEGGGGTVAPLFLAVLVLLNAAKVTLRRFRGCGN